MPHRKPQLFVLAALLLLPAALPSRAPAFELADGGRTFVYRARPGEAPARVAARFGVPEDQVGAFLAANGIADATRVPVGFEYRMANPLVPRLEALRGELDRLRAGAAAGAARARRLEHALARARARAVASAAGAERLASLEARWPFVLAALALALCGLAATSWLARRATARLAGATRHARALEQELEERRRTSLAQRQEAGRRIVALEDQVRRLELARPRAATGGRG